MQVFCILRPTQPSHFGFGMLLSFTFQWLLGKIIHTHSRYVTYVHIYSIPSTCNIYNICSKCVIYAHTNSLSIVPCKEEILHVKHYRPMPVGETTVPSPFRIQEAKQGSPGQAGESSLASLCMMSWVQGGYRRRRMCLAAGMSRLTWLTPCRCTGFLSRCHGDAATC